MARLSRFACASSSLTLKALLRKTQRGLWTCFVLGIAIHLSLMQIGGFEAERQTAKPLTTQFIKRQPRLTKPLELKKRPQPKRRPMQRKMVSVKAKVKHGESTGHIRVTQVVERLARPSVRIGRATGFGAVASEPRAYAGMIEGTKEPEQKIDMDLELLDMDALDTGRYHALVIMDPEDKRNIRGFLHLAVVFSKTIDATERQLYYTWGSIHYRRIVGLTELLNALNEYTDITGDIWSGYSFASRELFKTPWVLVSTFVPFRLAESEAQNIGEYLTCGGFLFADNYWASSIGGYTHLKQMFRDALATQGLLFGKHWGFEKLSNDHPIYHCYFDFDGPPMGNDAGVVSGGLQYPGGTEMLSYLEGVPVGGGIAGIVSNKGYLPVWRQWRSIWRKDSTRQLQFGVNTIVFALTREGSITHRLMDSIK